MLKVKYVKNSRNNKLSKNGNVDCTYVSVKDSCPDSCELKNKVCYAQVGYTLLTVSKLDKEPSISALEIAKQEAKAIDNSYLNGKIPPNKKLRLHVSGESRTIRGSRRD